MCKMTAHALQSKIAVIALFFITATAVFTQETLKSVEEEYYDFLSLTGVVKNPTLGYRTMSDSQWNFIEHTETSIDEDGNETETVTSTRDSSINVWKRNNLGKKYFINGNTRLAWKLFGPDLYMSYNTAAPYGQNDGALWQGKGFNANFTTGGRFEAYGVEITIKPQVSFSQNLAFKLLPSIHDSQYSYFWGHAGDIDLPQRFGDSSFFTFDWGDSEIRYTWKTLTIGFGTQSPWLGPAYLNPMLGSNNAASYPKFDIGLRRQRIVIPKINWYLGDIEARMWTGLLTESDYFDSDKTNDYQMVNGISISYAPSFIPGLTLGVSRIFLTKWRWKNLKYIGRLFTLSRANDITGEGEDQKVALNMSWHFPKTGFTVYGEFGIDDFSSNSVANFFHTAIYTVGIQQYIPLPLYKLFPKKLSDVTLRSVLILEFNNFEMSQDFQLQWEYMGYYSHVKIKQGYTNRGQILGAGSGYFGNSQFIGYKVLYQRGSTTIFFHRHCPDNNYIFNKAVNNVASSINDNWYAAYEAHIVVGAESTFFALPSLHITGKLAYTYINQYLYDRNSNLHNFQFALRIKYNF